MGRAIRGTIDPEAMNLLRWIVAAAVFLPITARRLMAHRTLLWSSRWWLMGLTLTGVIGFQHTTYTALTLSPVANAVLLLATTPLMIVASSAALGQGQLGTWRLMAVLVSLLGVAVLLGEGDPRAVLALDLSIGDLWLLGAVICWTAYTQLLRQTPKGMPGDVSLMASMLVGLPFLAVLAWWRSDTVIAEITPVGWLAVAYVGLGAALAAFLAWGYGVARKGPDGAALYLNLIPVFAIGLAWALLGEPVTGGQLVGAACVVAALLMAAKARD